MGTRLVATKESESHENAKQFWIKGTEEDTVISDRFDGINCRVLRNKAADDLLKKRLPVIDAIRAALRMKRTLGLSFTKLIRSAINLQKVEQRSLASAMRFAISSDLLRIAVVDGDPKGHLFCFPLIAVSTTTLSSPPHSSPTL